jgi:hypothetical protein
VLSTTIRKSAIAVAALGASASAPPPSPAPPASPRIPATEGPAAAAKPR